MRQWKTYYRRCQGDRLYHFSCRRGPAAKSGRYREYCQWTDYIYAPGHDQYVSLSAPTMDISLEYPALLMNACTVRGGRGDIKASKLGYCDARSVLRRAVPMSREKRRVWLVIVLRLRFQTFKTMIFYEIRGIPFESCRKINRKPCEVGALLYIVLQFND